MKKFVLVLVILMAVTGATLFAQDASSILAAIPSATYAHPTDGSTWTFSATGITVRGKDGTCEIPGRDMKGLAAANEGLSPGITFSYDTGLFNRTYRFILVPADGSIRRIIDRPGMPQDVVTLTKR